jgi:dTDP-4-dehydrorhamnose reductase
MNSSPYDGQSLYGRTKALGEINNTKDLTIRTSIIGPELSIGGKSIFDWFCKQNGEIQGYTNILWGGVTTIELAKYIDATLSHNITGIRNLCGIYPISKFELLTLLKNTFKKTNATIKPALGKGYNTRLMGGFDDLDYRVPDYLEMLEKMHEWIVDHNRLYTHYQI